MLPFQPAGDEPDTVKKPLSPAEIYQTLRAQALRARADEIGLPEEPGAPFGVLTETGYAAAVVSLVAMGEGTVSLYFSSGGGMLGGGKHDRVREAGLELVGDSADYIRLMETTKSFPLPGIGRVRFYILTPEGVYSYEASEHDLIQADDPLAPLYHQAQQVIAEFRRVAG